MTITLESIKADADALAAKIAIFEGQSAAKVAAFYFPEATIELRQGEHYAGLIVGTDGEPSYHLVLLQGEAESINWADAKAWAAGQGGELPTRREQSLLFANLKDQFKSNYYWSSQAHESESAWAWYQGFGSGFQLDDPKSSALRARAVRRLPI